MSDSNTSGPRPGPWGAPAPDRDPSRAFRPEADSPLVPGQSPAWAIGSTLALGGLLWWIMGSWVFAVAGIFGLLVHEYGHVLAMNRYGMGPARIYIIPFLGGAARGQREAPSEWLGVLVSLAGPAFGLLAMGPFVLLWALTGEAIWMAGALFIALINLVNLAPAPPLDGSRALGPVLARIHPMLEKVALIAVGVGVVYWGVTNGAFIFAAFLAVAVIAHLRRGAWRAEAGPLSWPEAGKSVVLYLITAAACAAAGIAVLLPLSDGSLPDAIRVGGAFLGFR